MVGLDSGDLLVIGGKERSDSGGSENLNEIWRMSAIDGSVTKAGDLLKVTSRNNSDCDLIYKLSTLTVEHHSSLIILSTLLISTTAEIQMLSNESNSMNRKISSEQKSLLQTLSKAATVIRQCFLQLKKISVKLKLY